MLVGAYVLTTSSPEWRNSVFAKLGLLGYEAPSGYHFEGPEAHYIIF